MAEKLSANEIVKALICCCDDSDGVAKCAICPFNIDDYQDFCVDELLEQALSLITSQQAEMERLREALVDNEYANCVAVKNGLIYTHTLGDYDKLIGDISAEAIKEFAERLCEDRVSNDPVVIAVRCELKEMVGDSDA